MQSIAIVDYGMANLRSVQKGFEKVGFHADITGDPNRVAEADKVVLPGVGAFRDAIARLREADLVAPLMEHLRSDKPFFGICLGLQLLFTKSHEDGEYEGLGFFEGDVVRFPQQPGLKVPHMGWNQLDVVRRSQPLTGFPIGGSVYFVHSYYPVPADSSIIATQTEYAGPFASSVWKDRVFATQFHPEKSQKLGLEMLRHFGNW